jgi:hypothetical protein
MQSTVDDSRWEAPTQTSTTPSPMPVSGQSAIVGSNRNPSVNGGAVGGKLMAKESFKPNLNFADWAATAGLIIAGSVTGPEEGLGLVEANWVYRSVNAAGRVNYAGITNNLARRAAQQLAEKGINIEPVLSNLTRAQARGVEQALIEIHGLGKEGGTLLNKINSIAQSNPDYARLLQVGYDLLRMAGYK